MVMVGHSVSNVTELRLHGERRLVVSQLAVAAAARAAETVHSAYTSYGRAREDAEFLRSFEAALAAEGLM